MTQDSARFRVGGHPTDAELAALVTALEQVVAEPDPAKSLRRPRVWPRISLRSHAHQLLSTLHPGTDPGHHHLAPHPLEES